MTPDRSPGRLMLLGCLYHIRPPYASDTTEKLVLPIWPVLKNRLSEGPAMLMFSTVSAEYKGP